MKKKVFKSICYFYFVLLIFTSCNKKDSPTSNVTNIQTKGSISDVTSDKPGAMRIFDCAQIGCEYPDRNSECPCATCWEGSGNCLPNVDIYNAANVTNVGNLDKAIKTGKIKDFFVNNPDVWNTLFPSAPKEALVDLQKGKNILKMYSINGDKTHLYTIVDSKSGEPANY